MSQKVCCENGPVTAVPEGIGPLLREDMKTETFYEPESSYTTHLSQFRSTLELKQLNSNEVEQDAMPKQTGDQPANMAYDVNIIVANEHGLVNGTSNFIANGLALKVAANGGLHIESMT